VVITAADSQSPTILGTSQACDVATSNSGESFIYLPLMWRD
jgi:hypothetical protein